mgnify:CR=1 FL=1
MIIFSQVGFVSEEVSNGVILGGLVLSISYFIYVANFATREPHFRIGRYISTAGLAFCIFLICYPIFCEITGVFGDLRELVAGFVLLFPMLLIRKAISARRETILGTIQRSKPSSKSPTNKTS